jgi:hypothetical protein
MIVLYLVLRAMGISNKIAPHNMAITTNMFAIPKKVNISV